MRRMKLYGEKGEMAIPRVGQNSLKGGVVEERVGETKRGSQLSRGGEINLTKKPRLFPN